MRGRYIAQLCWLWIATIGPGCIATRPVAAQESGSGGFGALLTNGQHGKGVVADGSLAFLRKNSHSGFASLSVVWPDALGRTVAVGLGVSTAIGSRLSLRSTASWGVEMSTGAANGLGIDAGLGIRFLTSQSANMNLELRGVGFAQPRWTSWLVLGVRLYPRGPASERTNPRGPE